MRRWRWCVPVLAVVVAAGCGTTATNDQPAGSSATNESTEGTKPGPVVLDVTIIDGQVTPRGARVNLKTGQPLTLAVHSDSADELHIHTDPEQEFEVKARGNQRFTFSVDQPGRVVVELHQRDVVIAELLVRQ